LTRLLNFFGSGRKGQCLIRRFQFLVEGIDFFLERNELAPRIFLLAQGGDRMFDFFCIDLGGEIDCDHNGIAFDRQVGLLVEHQD